MTKRTSRHLISLDDLSDAELRDIVERGAALARRAAAGEAVDGAPLAGDVVGVYFRKTSTRTRTAFSSGALRLGAGLIAYGPDDLQLNTGESTEDTGRVMARMLDVLVARTAGDPQEMRAWAAQHRMAVVNAMSAEEHPTQALADLTTLTERFGAVDGLAVLYVGEGNNSAVALALGLARYRGVRLELRTPPGYGLPAGVLERARHLAGAHGSTVVERHDLAQLPADLDAVYTTRWQTTGTSKPDPDWRRVFAPFQVDERLMEHAPKAVFLHDLPAHRGEEVTAGVLDGPASIAFQQAENKLHSAMAVLEWCRAVPA
ncbi:ornithine carbamoyltransferase [Kitasatospora paracochleata]|uniref:Ornithine carbamoyltransferase n=1 Tax=Kitasatospora paracochleata TaxID=58354 RepID=A0ABT1JBB1_9ACTN|nr:ornithine carbamoyltransferase [Kitasatospora paracochleata]MCP2314368.1 ornithine carbamoyltransferase [Kitasatospora paracochleata]